MSKTPKFGSHARKEATRNKSQEREVFVAVDEHETLIETPPTDHNPDDMRETFFLEALELDADFYLMPRDQWRQSWKVERATEESLRLLRRSGWRGADEDVLEAFCPAHPHHAEACRALATRAGKRIKSRVEAALDVYFACYQPRPLWETVLGALTTPNTLIEL